MTTIAQLLGTKPQGTWSVSPAASVYQAIEIMALKQIGALLVLEEARMVGIVSERDYARKVILQRKSSHETTVREIMTSPVFTVRPDQYIEDCMEIMTARRIRHLPVLRDEELLGVISIGDVVKALLAEREIRIEQLENYITGRT